MDDPSLGSVLIYADVNLGIVIPLFVFFEMLIEKNRMAHPVDKKTDWFYKNEEYDRKLDDRADKNNYRTL